MAPTAGRTAAPGRRPVYPGRGCRREHRVPRGWLEGEPGALGSDAASRGTPRWSRSADSLGSTRNGLRYVGPGASRAPLEAVRPCPSRRRRTAWNSELAIHGLFRSALLCLERRGDDADPRPSRFIELPPRPDPDKIAKELDALFKQDGGKTEHGFVQREPIDTRRPLRVVAHHLARLELQSNCGRWSRPVSRSRSSQRRSKGKRRRLASASAGASATTARSPSSTLRRPSDISSTRPRPSCGPTAM